MIHLDLFKLLTLSCSKYKYIIIFLDEYSFYYSIVFCTKSLKLQKQLSEFSGCSQILLPILWRSLSYAKSTCLENTSPQWYCFLNFYYTNLSSMMTIFLATCLHSSGTTIQILCLLWHEYSYSTQFPIAKSYSCQCLTIETSTQGNKSYTTETPSISYSSFLYIRLVVIL